MGSTLICLFFHFLVSSLPFAISFYLPESNPLLSFNNQVREVHLYTENHRHGLYLQINMDGKVTGSRVQTSHSVMQLKSVKPGHVVIRGQTSSLFLCVNSGGNLRGQGVYEECECSFKELLLADGYTRFLSSQYDIPVSLGARNSPDRLSVPFTRFLPLRNTLTVESVTGQPSNNPRHFDVDSDDPLGIGLNAVRSPHLSIEQ